MNKTLYIFWTACALQLTTACNPTYMPPAMHLPLPHEAANDSPSLTVAAMTGSNGIDIQLSRAYKGSLLMGALSLDTLGTSSTGGQRNSHFYGEAGWGKFSTFDGNHGSMELALGIGLGQGNNVDTDDLNATYTNTDLRYIRPFIQADMGYQLGWFGFGIANRLAYLHVDYITHQDTPSNRNEGIMLLETAPFISIGPPLFRAFIQYGLSIPIYTPNKDAFNASILFPFIVSFGIQSNFGSSAASALSD